MHVLGIDARVGCRWRCRHGSCSPAELTASGSVRETSSSGTVAKVVSCKPVNMDSAVTEVHGRNIGNKRAASDTSP